MSQARKERRVYQNWLKKNNPKGYEEMKSADEFQGKTIHKANVEASIVSQQEQLEALQTRMIVALRKQGKTNEEIDAHISEWIKNIKIVGLSR